MTIFRMYQRGISENNLIWQSNQSNSFTEYGDTILSPKLKKEVNKADSLEFMILPTNEYYDSFEKMTMFVYLTRDNKCIFRGRVSDIKTDIYGQRTITCEGDLAFLSDSIQAPNKKSSNSKVGQTNKIKSAFLYSADGGASFGSDKNAIKMSVENYFRSLISEHNLQVQGYSKGFTVGSITISNKNDVESFERTSYQDTSSLISSELLSVYGGILRTRYTNGTAYIDWLEEYTESNNQEIRFGVNMIDLDQEPPTDDTWSVLLPTGDENLTIESVNNNSRYLENDTAVAKYGYIVHHHSFSNVKKADKLLEKARQYLRTHSKIFPDNIIVKAIDLQLIGESNDPLELGDRIKVVSTPHGLNKTMACIAMELDIYNPENNSYTIGEIMPPDKEKKKEPLSEKHSSARNSSSRGISNNANAIGGLNTDTNINANNINVNAQNIAVNALNIAVNAENIAVVAKNIAIAAETIDIKATQITASFGEETDDLHGYIQASAEGIKSSFSDNTTGLSSYFEQKAGEITAGVESADGNIRSKITLTESSLITQFNSTIYGDNGVVKDYEGKITATSESLTSDYTTKISNTKAEITTAYEGKITQTSTSLTSDYTAKIANAKTEITTAYESKITQTANSITTEVSKKVGKDEVISRINQTAESIVIQASKIDLSGYVTVSQLSTTNAKIDNLISGSAIATKIVASSMKVASGTFEIGDSSNNAILKYRNTEYYSLTVSMPGVVSSFTALGWSYYNSAYRTSLSLAHSHSVTTNSDGTITIGGSVATDASGRSFRIADTKAYKDGVSAAIDSVTVTSVGLNTTDYPTSGVGDSSSDTNAIYYTPSNAQFHARIRANASNGKHREANITIPADKAYDHGASNVRIIELGLNTEDYPVEGVGDGSSDTIHPVYYSKYYTKYYARIRAEANNDDDKTTTVSFSAQKAYDHGYNNVEVNSMSASTAGLVYKSHTVSNKYYANVKFTVNITNGTEYARTVSSIKFEDIYDNGYDDGYAAGKDSVYVTSVYRSENDTYNSGTHNTTIHVVGKASNDATKYVDFTVSGSSAYNAGYDAGYTAGRRSVNMNDVTVTSVVYNVDDQNGDEATVSISLPYAAGTKTCKRTTLQYTMH